MADLVTGLILERSPLSLLNKDHHINMAHIHLIGNIFPELV
jgi:hypothetical protein